MTELLNRQTRLLDYLTSGDAIFGLRGERPLRGALRGLDRAMLDLEASFSHQKRMQKIAAVFPRTFELLGPDLDATTRAFAEACPPADISRLENATQFLEFLQVRWAREPARPAYLPDVAACELACLRVRVETDRPDAIEHPGEGVRRAPGVVLLLCSYDVHAIFGSASAPPEKRGTPLAIVLDRQSGEPRIFEIAPEIFDLLGALDDWTVPATGNGLLDARELIRSLEQADLLEVRL
jgi:hypothetical protein